MIKVGFSYLEDVLVSHGETLSSLAQKLSITSQAIQTWKTTNEIPVKRTVQLAKLFSLDPHQIDQLLGTMPLQLSFRTKGGNHLDESDASERTKIRSRIIYERFFKTFNSKLKYDLKRLRAKISEASGDFSKIANCIRSEFIIPDYRPLDYSNLNALIERVGVKALYMPFKQLGLNTGTEDEQTAILYCRDDCFSMLIDSNRTIDEAHFDKTHEMLHVIFNGIFKQDNDFEKLIDRVCGELIYPRKFIIEKFFDGDEGTKPIKNKELLVSRFMENTKNLTRILSPRGLARAMRDSGLTSRNSELFKYLHDEFHEIFRANSLTYSVFGKMNFEFSNRDLLLDFYSSVVNAVENENKYPLFSNLKADLVTDAIPTADFADTFGLSYSDALVIKSIWEAASESN